MLGYLTRFVVQEVEDPEEVAEQLLVVYDGTLVAASVRPELEAVVRAKRMARAVIGSARARS